MFLTFSRFRDAVENKLLKCWFRVDFMSLVTGVSTRRPHRCWWAPVAARRATLHRQVLHRAIGFQREIAKLGGGSPSGICFRLVDS
jgi:hypothetical protein